MKSLDDYIEEDKPDRSSDMVKYDAGQIVASEVHLGINEFEEAKRRMGFIDSRRLTKEQGRALLDAAKLEYAKKLEVWEKLVGGRGEVAKKQIDATVKMELEKIDRQHLEHLEELNIGNLETRGRLQLQLAKIAQQMYQDIEDSNIAQALKDDLIKRMMKERTRLADELSETAKV